MRSGKPSLGRLRLASTSAALALAWSANSLCSEPAGPQETSPAAAHPHAKPLHKPPTARLDVSLDHRWFQADRHYIGDVRQSYRERARTQTINNVHLFDLELAYPLSARSRMTLTIPFLVASRSQVLNNQGGSAIDRFATDAAGLRDIRIVTDFWLRDPRGAPQWNVAIGSGVVIPTGNDSVRDDFEIFDLATRQIRARQQPVDTSIQPGSGGWGFPLKFAAFAQTLGGWRGYFDGTYIITPKDTNGVATYLPNPYEAVISIPDSYAARMGAEYRTPIPGTTISLGARMEGTPVHDLVGRSDGFRRPGYLVFMEPGVSVKLRDSSLSIKIPVNVYSNRLRSVADERWSDATGRYIWGDAIYPGISIITKISTHW
jgi:hypothetical protein